MTSNARLVARAVTLTGVVNVSWLRQGCVVNVSLR